ncbi:Icarapin-like [Melipona quadrifasciata]|uniref:Icarapin-like n=1 Tax=Melipona quadrifasciata TaxID=166423 RepID=A0A0M9AC21_9HYME|nr:Icarapin-like [Melipona quadrifasciata]
MDDKMTELKDEKRLRDQMAGILSHIPEQGVVNWSKIPEGANTTSTTKVINGHVLTINETTYTDGNDEYSTLIRVRVIDVRPQNDTLLLTESEADAEVTTLPTITVTSKEDRTTPSRSVETVEEFDNEIPKNQVDTLTA